MTINLFLVLNFDAVSHHYPGEAPLAYRENERVWTAMLRIAEDTPSIASSSHSNASKGHRKTASIASSTKEKTGEDGNDTKTCEASKVKETLLCFHYCSRTSMETPWK
jgi:hypothetical protein